jgi:hypothetical protein
MRKFVLTMAAAVAIVAGGGAFAPPAQALPASGALALPLTQADGLLQEAAYTCGPIWRCGRYGCGWERVCYWRVGPRYFGPHYRYRRWRHR